MVDKTASLKALHTLFKRFLVVDINKLTKTLQTTSRMTIFRRLSEIGYFSSFTNTGRYYTLAHIPQFNNYGLWFHQGVGFSRFGTLKATIVAIIEGSTAGFTQLELSHILNVRNYGNRHRHAPRPFFRLKAGCPNVLKHPEIQVQSGRHNYILPCYCNDGVIAFLKMESD